ncbi:hypothetical protein B0H13DRAFT_1850985 [Mycena leptocephala]|nr:hypothetical protein B0H13DRAFT_1850985 [Mycena leptocephala]
MHSSGPPENKACPKPRCTSSATGATPRSPGTPLTYSPSWRSWSTASSRWSRGGTTRWTAINAGSASRLLWMGDDDIKANYEKDTETHSSSSITTRTVYASPSLYPAARSADGCCRSEAFCITTMLRYNAEFPFPVAFPPQPMTNVLAVWLSKQKAHVAARVGRMWWDRLVFVGAVNAGGVMIFTSTRDRGLKEEEERLQFEPRDLPRLVYSIVGDISNFDVAVSAITHTDAAVGTVLSTPHARKRDTSSLSPRGRSRCTISIRARRILHTPVTQTHLFDGAQSFCFELLWSNGQFDHFGHVVC